MQKEFGVANFNAVKLFISTLCVLVWIFVPLRGQDQLSNLDLADQIYYSVLDSVFNGLTEPELKIGGLGGEEEAFLRSGWIQFWSTRQSGNDSISFTCTIDRFEFSLQYHDEPSRLLGLNERMTRKGNMAIRGWVGKESGAEVIRAFNVSKSFTDFIEAKNVAQLERGPFTFLRGKQYTRSLWTRYLEPALVIVSVTAIVYLFFSVRT